MENLAFPQYFIEASVVLCSSVLNTISFSIDENYSSARRAFLNIGFWHVIVVSGVEIFLCQYATLMCRELPVEIAG